MVSLSSKALAKPTWVAAVAKLLESDMGPRWCVFSIQILTLPVRLAHELQSIRFVIMADAHDLVVWGAE